MAKEKRMAWINWSREKQAWVLRLWIDNEWAFSKSWRVMKIGEGELTGDSVDYVHDSIICEIAHLQDLGYEVKVTV